jgi:hypothetical protein
MIHIRNEQNSGNITSCYDQRQHCHLSHASIPPPIVPKTERMKAVIQNLRHNLMDSRGDNFTSAAAKKNYPDSADFAFKEVQKRFHEFPIV